MKWGIYKLQPLDDTLRMNDTFIRREAAGEYWFLETWRDIDGREYVLLVPRGRNEDEPKAKPVSD